MINLNNFESWDKSLFDIVILQKDVGGGITSQEEIDIIQRNPNAKSLLISGLNQDTFEYLINHYGYQFESISFWKNKMVNDLSLLGSLVQLKYVHYFFNQRVTKLWDMSNNTNLKGIALYDFSRLHLIDNVATAPCLEYFSLGNKVWSKMEIESFKPLLHSTVSHFCWWGDKVLDNDFACLSKSHIKELDMNITRFRMGELARLNARFSNLKGSITVPYIESSIVQGDKTTTYYYLCKGKKRLIKGEDDFKLEKYLSDFYTLVEQYKEGIINK